MKKILFLMMIATCCAAKVTDTRRYDSHTKAVTAIAFDKEGRSIITGSLDGTMCKRGLGQTYEGKKVEGLGSVTQLKRIAKFLAVVHEKCDCGDDKAKHFHPEFYNISDLSYKSSGAIRQGGHDFSIADMQIINGKSMVSVDLRGKLFFLYNCMKSVGIDLPLFSRLINDRQHVTGLRRLTAASPSRIIGISGQDNDLYYLDPEIRTLVGIKKMAKETEKITALAALKHYLLAFTNQDNKVMLLNSKTGADLVKELGEHGQEIVAINKINKRLFATADKDGVVKVWNAKTGAVQLELQHDEKNVKTGEKSPVTALAVHWNKKKQEGKIAIGYQNGVTVVSKYDLEKTIKI